MYGKESCEYITTLNRVKMCTKLQSAQIDKCKIGQNVKGIPRSWVNRLKVDELDDEITIKEKEFNNSILLDRHPYFFTYLYKDTKRKYNKHKEFYDLNCKVLYGISLEELINKENKTDEELEYIATYNKYSPVIDNPCVMNNLCRYMENISFDIRNKIKTNKLDVFVLLFDDNIDFNDKNYKKIREKIKEMNKKIANEASFQMMKVQRDKATKDDFVANLEEIKFTTEQQVRELFSVVNNEEELLNYVIKCAYHDNITRAMHLLWEGFADILFSRLLNRCGYKINIPVKDKNGELEYLGSRYSIKEVVVNE